MPKKVRITTLVLSGALTLMSSGPLLAQTDDPAAPRVRIGSGSTRISGRLVAVDGDTATIAPDADRDRIVHVPRSRITEAAISEGRRPRAVAVLAGVGAGVAAGYFGFLIGVSGRGASRTRRTRRSIAMMPSESTSRRRITAPLDHIRERSQSQILAARR